MGKIVAVLLPLLVSTALQAQTPIPKENVISYWTGEPNPGTGRRLDLIGSNHLWDAPESAVVAGVIGNATIFDGSGHLRTKLRTDTYASGIQTQGRDITYAGWLQVGSLGSDQILAGRWGRWAPGREHRLWYDASAGVLKLDWSDSANVSQVTIADDLTVTADTWYFVAYGRSDSAAAAWLKVTPKTDGQPRPVVILTSVPANPSGQSGELWFGYDQIDKVNCYGKWDEWGIYNKVLSADEIAWLFNAGAGRTYADFVYINEPVLGYFHDMEQEEHVRGHISYYSFTEATAALSTEQAASGNQSLKITGSWGQIQIFNDSNTDYWCTTDKCRVSMDIYMVNFTGSMLFQMDGKTTTVLTDLDTNEGLGVMFYSGNGERGFSMGSNRTSGYNLPLDQWVHIDYLRDRRRTAPHNSAELWVDGELVLAVEGEPAPYEPPPYVAEAWHHISLGNDRIEQPTFYIDNFEVAPDPWPDTTTTAAYPAQQAEPAGLQVMIRPNPMRDQVQFIINRNVTADQRTAFKGIFIYDNTGNVVSQSVGANGRYWDGTDFSGQPVKPGIYYYHITGTNATGSIIRTR